MASDVPHTWVTLPQFSWQEVVFLHLQLTALVEAAVEGLELPALTKQVPHVLWPPRGGR